MRSRRIGIVAASFALAMMAQIVAADTVMITNHDIAAVVPGTDFPDNEWWVSLPKFDAPQVPKLQQSTTSVSTYSVRAGTIRRQYG